MSTAPRLETRVLGQELCDQYSSSPLSRVNKPLSRHGSNLLSSLWFGKRQSPGLEPSERPHNPLARLSTLSRVSSQFEPSLQVAFLRMIRLSKVSVTVPSPLSKNRILSNTTFRLISNSTGLSRLREPYRRLAGLASPDPADVSKVPPFSQPCPQTKNIPYRESAFFSQLSWSFSIQHRDSINPSCWRIAAVLAK